jgi:glutathione S-transferase
MNLSLVIGNKNYSSWSMRPWVLLRQFDIPFTERLIKFHSADWEANITTVSPSKLVPNLWEDGLGTGFSTWDSLAIMERIADLFPDKAIWPRDDRMRARARSVAAEMHSGFRALRSAMPMNIRSSHPGKGHTPDALKDAARIQSVWSECLKASGGPFLFGAFTAADAMYAPVVTRFRTYGVQLDDVLSEYSRAVLAARGVADWINDSRSETDFLAEDEPYASAPD